MEHEYDAENAMETGTSYEEIAQESPKSMKFDAHLPHSDSTVLSVTSSYISEFTGDNR